MHLSQLINETSLIAQFALCKLGQALQPGAVVCLSKQHIKPQQKNFSPVEEFINQISHLVAAPWPMTHLRMAFLSVSTMTIRSSNVRGMVALNRA